MAFSNPTLAVKRGHRVDVVIGSFGLPAWLWSEASPRLPLITEQLQRALRAW